MPALPCAAPPSHAALQALHAAPFLAHLRKLSIWGPSDQGEQEEEGPQIEGAQEAGGGPRVQLPTALPLATGLEALDLSMCPTLELTKGGAALLRALPRLSRLALPQPRGAGPATERQRALIGELRRALPGADVEESHKGWV